MASACGAAADRPLVFTPPYALRDGDGRNALLDELTALVAALDAPIQVWHGDGRCDVEVAGSGAAAVLTRQLAESARPRRTCLVGAAAGSHMDAEVGSEARDHLVLADGRLVRTFALTGWPSAVTPGWLDAIASGCVAMALHLVPMPRDAALRLLRRRLAAL